LCLHQQLAKPPFPGSAYEPNERKSSALWGCPWTCSAGCSSQLDPGLVGPGCAPADAERWLEPAGPWRRLASPDGRRLPWWCATSTVGGRHRPGNGDNFVPPPEAPQKPCSHFDQVTLPSAHAAGCRPPGNHHRSRHGFTVSDRWASTVRSATVHSQVAR
jgi:hypothetical protein